MSSRRSSRLWRTTEHEAFVLPAAAENMTREQLETEFGRAQGIIYVRALLKAEAMEKARAERARIAREGKS